jgi:hypothetical protein
VAGSGRVKRRDWLTAAAMSAGIGVFLRVASPSGGRLHAPGSAWLVAGLATVGVVLLALTVTFGLGHHRGASGPRRAAVLGAATGISWGFMAAVIKELSSHLADGAGAVFSSWSLYLLVAAGAATMLLASHALAAGPLAASQPGFTILDPLSASLLGCSYSASTSGPGSLTWPARCWSWAWSSPPPSLATAVTPARTPTRPIRSRTLSAAPRPCPRHLRAAALHAPQALDERYPAQAGPALQHARRTGEVVTITLIRAGIRENHAADSAQSCRTARVPAEPGHGPPGPPAAGT